MTSPTLGTLHTEPAGRRPDLLAASVFAALGDLTPGALEISEPAPGALETGEPAPGALEPGETAVGVVEIDPELADTAAFCAAYEVSPAASANCVVLSGKREGVVRYAAAVVLATTRADVNGVIRRWLDVRKISFAPMDLAVELTGMEYGGITPIGLPPEWPVLVDAAVTTAGPVVIGSGLRRSKLVVDGALLATLPAATVLDAATPVATVPDAATPVATVPDAAIPTATVPDAAIPTATVPDATVPTAP